MWEIPHVSFGYVEPGKVLPDMQHLYMFAPPILRVEQGCSTSEPAASGLTRMWLIVRSAAFLDPVTLSGSADENTLVFGIAALRAMAELDDPAK